MKYISQLNYEHIPYYHNTDEGGIDGNVRKSGCGLCCVCMMLEHITVESLSIEECVKLSEENGANHGRGTDMSILAPIIAEKFDLNYRKTDDLGEAIDHLKRGGHIIAHVVSKERGAEHGLFTNSGHYISLISTDGKTFCIFDPSYREEKFSTPERIGKLNAEHFPFLYCDTELVHRECALDKPKYHLFSHK